MSRKDYEHLPHSGPDGTWEDSVHVTLRKELVEEIGVTVGHLEYVGNCTFIRPDGVAVLGLRFMAPFVKGPVTLNTKEVVECVWVGAEELSKYDFLGNVPLVIQRVDRILAQRELRKATGLF
jgi:NADH pyrophosphatase NudC (nudix superfamily)